MNSKLMLQNVNRVTIPSCGNIPHVVGIILATFPPNSFNIFCILGNI